MAETVDPVNIRIWDTPGFTIKNSDSFFNNLRKNYTKIHTVAFFIPEKTDHVDLAQLVKLSHSVQREGIYLVFWLILKELVS